MENDELYTLIKRLDRLGIRMELIGNFPWIYIKSINGRIVSERFYGNYGFTAAFYPIRKGEPTRLTDIGEIFKLIRKYIRK